DFHVTGVQTCALPICPYPSYCTQLGRNEPPPSLDHEFIAAAPAFFERGEKQRLDFAVRNTQRAIGARASAHVVRRVGMNALPERSEERRVGNESRSGG